MILNLILLFISCAMYRTAALSGCYSRFLVFSLWQLCSLWTSRMYSCSSGILRTLQIISSWVFLWPLRHVCCMHCWVISYWIRRRWRQRWMKTLVYLWSTLNFRCSHNEITSPQFIAPRPEPRDEVPRRCWRISLNLYLVGCVFLSRCDRYFQE